MEKGKSKVDMENEGWHWYYFGKWKYYNEQGQLLKIHIYENGKMVDSIIYKKKD